ncbi:short-chain dehydrogenase [Frankia sp. CcI49]|uniref:SDR family oxidoreductase n=1 Tax=unclassified Frankia TaxID=2632575 RepID=UPI0006C9F919|nr:MULTISPECIES: SDR family oxidoreductase [unclassified Frankia]KPM50582.1 short-chain dehydrogenase [Frankia sp. R43]ONH51328.1 short-chain dehydrogenase [Frankia sp. CcI49]
MNIGEAVVFVTGASSGIGAATARAASQAGARVVLAARREDRIRQIADELGDAVAVRCDVTDAGQVEVAVRTAMDTFGRIDVLCNIAGQGLHVPLEKIDPDDFRAVLELNLVAPLVTMQAVVPVMRRQGAGSIVNVSSGITFSALPGSAGYAASKAGLSKLSAVARAELANAGIVVSTMFPFITGTEFTRSLRGDTESASQLESSHAPKPQSPRQVADAILDLIRTGAEQADLVPEQFGGSYKS